MNIGYNFESKYPDLSQYFQGSQIGRFLTCSHPLPHAPTTIRPGYYVIDASINTSNAENTLYNVCDVPVID
jgi:hypothetical protein